MSGFTVTGAVRIDNGKPVEGTLTVTEERKHVASAAPSPDPNWSMVDQRNHFHAATVADGRVEYPTLTTRSRPCDGACGDPTHRESYYVCRICAEEIDPGTIPGPHHWTVPGMTAWELDVPGVLDYRAMVSVRFGDEDGELFGVAQVYSVTADMHVRRSRLVGVSPLGRRSP